MEFLRILIKILMFPLLPISAIIRTGMIVFFNKPLVDSGNLNPSGLLKKTIDHACPDYCTNRQQFEFSTISKLKKNSFCGNLRGNTVLANSPTLYTRIFFCENYSREETFCGNALRYLVFTWALACYHHPNLHSCIFQ